MLIDFYIHDLQEVFVWEPIWKVLLRLGVDARFVLEPPGLHSALGPRPDGRAVAPLMTPEVFEEAKAYLRARGYARLVRGRDQRADAVVTTQGADWFRRYRGLKFRTACGCAACREVPPHSDLNRGLDGVFVHGEHCRERVARWVPSQDIIVTGYPKFSPFFRGELDCGVWRLRFRLDPGRKTVVYFSTWGQYSSLDRFAEAVAALSNRFNVLYKPHPKNIRHDRRRFETLERARGVSVNTRERNSVPFLAVADIVLADARSGSLSETFLADRPVIGLSARENPDEADLLDGVSEAAPLCSDPDQLGPLVDGLLCQDDYAKARRRFTRRLYTTFNGYDDEVAAAALVNLAVRKRPRRRVVATI